MRSRRNFVWILFLVCVSLLAQEQGPRPNFTGIWKLDASRSTLNAQAPDSVTLYIHQNDPDFHLRRTEVLHGKSFAWSFHGRTDGKTLQQKDREGTKSTHMYWEGAQLVLEWKSNDRHGDQQQKTVRYSLRDGGRTLVAQEVDDNRETQWVFRKSG